MSTHGGKRSVSLSLFIPGNPFIEIEETALGCLNAFPELLYKSHLPLTKQSHQFLDTGEKNAFENILGKSRKCLIMAKHQEEQRKISLDVRKHFGNRRTCRSLINDKIATSLSRLQTITSSWESS